MKAAKSTQAPSTGPEIAEEKELSKALSKFMQTQRDLKTMLNLLEPIRPRGRKPSIYSQSSRRQSILGMAAYWCSNPTKAQAKLLKALDKRAQEIESKNTAHTGHCVTEPVQQNGE